jgi:3-hydroxyisobutyrate dehydrogenase
VKVGFVGLGNMGGPMARNLARAGFDVAVYDLDRLRMAALEGDGVRPARSAADVADGASAVLLSLPGPPEVEAAAGELLGRMAPGSVLVNVSTVSPALVRRLAGRAEERGIDVVDAPVTGAADGAREATLTFMVGAEPEPLERVRPLLDALGQTIVHMGPVGAGSAAKLLTNMLWFVHVVALADALALGVKAGIDLTAFARLIPESAGGSWVASHDLPSIVRGDDDESFTLALCCKDLRLIAELAGELGYDAGPLTLARERFETARERFGPAAGELAVTRLAEEAAGVSIRFVEVS